MTIYKDCLDTPNATATISVFGSSYGQLGTGNLCLNSVSDCPTKKWPYISHDVSAIVAEMELNGWDCVTTKDGYNAPVIKCTHRDTQAVIDAITTKDSTHFANAQRGYIRFGKCPKDGLSINHRDKIPELGVSVFDAEFTDNQYRLISNDALYATYLSVKDRPAYRIYGDVVGTGSDGEPVIKVIKAVKL